MTLEWNAEKPGLLGRPAGLGLRAREAERRPRSRRKGFVSRMVEGVRASVLAVGVRVVEAMGGGGLLGQPGVAGDMDFAGYRPLSQRIDALTRDLDGWTYDRQIREALYVYATNPLGRWLIDNLVDVVLGQHVGFTVKVDHERADLTPEQADEVQKEIYKHLEVFWTHPAHSLDTRVREYGTTQLVTGCLLLPVSFAEADGKPVDGVPMLDIIDAQQIAKVMTADRSAMVPGTVFYRGVHAQGDLKPLEIIRQKERGGPLDGEAFYFPLRGLLNQLMGTSYLMDVIDWLDRHDKFMFAALDRAVLTNSLAWHVSHEGFTATQCDEAAKKYKKEGTFVEPGSVVVTNDKTQIEPLSPDMAAGNVDSMARVYRTHILGAKSRPESWYSSGGETNRATASEQTDVSYKALERWQEHFRGIFEFMLAFAYDKGRAAQVDLLRKYWPERSSGALEITVNMPPIRERDFARVGAAITAIETALQAAVSDELLSHETAQAVFLTAASKLGADIDPTKEAERIEAEQEEKSAKDQERANASAKAILDAALLKDAAPTDEPKVPPPPPPPRKPAPEDATAAA